MGLNRLYTSSALLSLGLNILLGAPVMAQISSPALNDEIIVTALRAVPFTDVTSSVSILDADALNIRNSPFVVDQLRAVPGVAVSRNGGQGTLTQVRIRGAEANHTLVLLNGIEVSDPFNGETDFGLWSGLNTQRIEVARGEQSGLYGSDAIGGVVSITTGGDGFNIAGEAGSFETFRGQAGYHGQVIGTGPTFSYGLAGSGFTTDGVDIVGSEDGDRDGAESYSGIYTAALEFSPNVTLSGLASYRVTNTETDGFGVDADNETDAVQSIIAVTLDAQTGPVNHVLRANYNELERESFTGDQSTNEITGQRTKFSYSPSIDLGTAQQGFTVSGLVDVENEDFENSAQGLNDTFDTLGLAGEIRARYNGFVLNGSVRRDDNDNDFENTTTWRIGAAYNHAFSGKLRGSIGTGVQNPTFTELFGFGNDFIGNPNLDPERSFSWEIGLDQSFGPVNASVTYFNAELEDEIIFNAFFNGVINRENDSERSGIEFSADYQVNEVISIVASATRVDADGLVSGTTFSDITADNIQEIRVPEWTASSSINWESQTKDGLRAGLALDYVGEQNDVNFGVFPGEIVTLDSYILLSATAEYPVTKNLSLTLRGENLFDETITDVFGFNQPGAGVFIGFRLR